MFQETARVQALKPEPEERLIAVSDIHANLPYFKGLLEKLDFGPGDRLIIAGDFLEKGPCSLDTLHFIQDLCRIGNVHPLLGNCDSWEDAFLCREEIPWVMKYVRYRKKGLLWEMMTGIGIDPEKVGGFNSVRDTVREAYPEEVDFLCSLPHAIETEDFTFVHAGMRPDKPLREHTGAELMKYDNFLNRGHSFDRWVVAGHWPVMLYGEDKVSAAPVIDREHHIVSIDGGCVLKDDGQLNALILPRDGEDFSYVAYDPFPERTVLNDQQGGEQSYYIRWGDSTVEVLERGEEFSRCRHVRTGYEMDILTKYLFTGERVTDCNDCTDYVLPLKAGDRVRLIETTGRGYFVKHDSVSGWYFGELA